MNVFVFCYDANAALMVTARPMGRWPPPLPPVSSYPALREEGPMTAPRIVLLDNDPFSLGALHDLLDDAGYRIFRCRPQDVTDAHAVVKRARADLVILERWLAKREDGWAFLKRLWGDAETTHIPAIIVSGEPASLPVQADVLHALHCQVVRAPCDARELLGAIAAVLGPSPVQRERDLRRQTIPSVDPPIPITGTKQHTIPEIVDMTGQILGEQVKATGRTPP
jgi:DNA-binding NtrC family response regulator